MIVSDAGPLRYLVLLGYEDVIATFFGSLVIPYEVAMELNNEKSPPRVQHWLKILPPWASIAAPGPRLVVTAKLHEGELAAMALADRLSARMLLVDDLPAKQEAESRGLATMGTVGLLFNAGVAGLLNFPEALDRLLMTNFRLSQRTRDRFLKQWANR